MKLKYIAGCLALTSLLGSCNDDDFNPVTSGGEGPFGPYSLVVPIDMDDAGIKTRADFTEITPINNIWVGVFDAEDGRLIGSSSINEDVIIPSKTHENFTDITIKNLMFHDTQPKVYIASVVNYDGVMVYTSSKDTEALEPLKDVLDELTSWDEYINLAVDISSAKDINKGNEVSLMSGLYSVGHGNNTVDYLGVPSNDKDMTVVTPYAILFSGDYNYGNNGEINLPGQVHLRKLVSHIKVNLAQGDGITIINPTVKYYNIPKSVFLQERTTLEDARPFTTDWKEVTPASSDIYGGYSSYENGEENEYLFFKENEGNPTYNEIDRTWNFGFWHYENKHWGLDHIMTYEDREVMSSPGVFKSLVPEGSDINNGASYFIISAHVIDSKNNIEGDVNYLIHEGYCCKPNSDKFAENETGPQYEAIASRDFSTFRNTDYTYNIKILGLNNIKVKVESENGSDLNPGAYGDLVTVEEAELKRGGETLTINIPEGGKLEWALSIDKNYIGQFEETGKIAEKLKEMNYDFNALSEFFQSIVVDGTGSLSDELSSGEHTIVIPACPSGIIRNVYINYPVGKIGDSDFSSSMTKTTIYTQDASKLDTPIIKDYSLNPLYDDSQSGNYNKFIKGLSDNHIYWDAVDGADYYLISYNGNEVRYDPQLNEGKLNYAIPYSGFLENISGGTILSVSIKAVADIDNGNIISSQSETLSKNIWKFDCDFSKEKWASALNGAGISPNRVFSLDGLTISEGGGEIKIEKSVLQLGGGGVLPTSENPNGKRVLSFDIYSNGEIEVVGISSGALTNDEGPRNIIIKYGDLQTETQVNYSNAVTAKATINSFKEPIIGKVEPLKVYIYSSYKGINLSSVKFTPKD